MAKTVFYDADERDETLLRAHFEATDHELVFAREPLSDQNIIEDAEVISVFVTSHVDESVLSRMPRLRHIAARSTGFSHIDSQAAHKRDITITTVPSYGEHTVGEYAFSLLLALTRKVGPAQDQVLASKNVPGDLMGMDLSGKTLGVIGTGRIGMHVASIARGFSMNVIGYDLYPNEEKAREVGLSYVDLDAVFAQSDVISLHAPLTDQNHHLIGPEQIDSCKDGVIIINTARGELIDSQALLDGVVSRKIAAVGLDVIENEELLSFSAQLSLAQSSPKDTAKLSSVLVQQALLSLPNVIVTHHNAYNTREAIARINAVAAANIIDFWYDRTPNAIKVEPPRMGTFVLARHAESEWNALGKWTGHTDVHLSEKGFREAAMLGELIRDIPIDYAFASQQIRTLETLEGMLDSAQQFDVPLKRDHALNERDYGEYTGMNKWELKEKIGDDEFNGIRRGWDHPVPGGETLKDVYDRAIPYFIETILPLLREGKNVVVMAHGNTNRSLIKYIESISDEDIANVEMMFGKVILYKLDTDGKIASKEERHIDSPPPAA